MRPVYLIFLILILLGCLVPEMKAQDNPVISKISFVGNQTLRKETLLKQMNTKERAFTEKLAFWKKNSGFSNFALDEDILRLKKLYQQNGFLDPVITYELLPNKKNTKLKIIIHILEGNAVNIGTIDYNMPESLTFKPFIDSLDKVVPIKPFSRFRDESIVLTEKIIHDHFSSQGFPFVHTKKIISLNERLKTADLEFSISPGNKTYFGEIKVLGDTLIPRPYINKHIKIKQGNLFSQIKLEETQEELFGLGLFRYVTIRALMDSVINNNVPIIIQLKELPRWSLKTGLGYGTEDKIRVSMLLTRLNFLGGGRTLSIKGQHSYFIPLSIETKFIQPDIWSKNLDFIVNPFFSREREESYTVDRLGTAVTFQKNITKTTSAYLSYTFGKDKVKLTTITPLEEAEDPKKRNRNKSGITFGFNGNTTNDLFSPTKGWKIDGTATYMGIGFNTEFHYYKLMAEVDYFHPLLEKVIFAFKFKSGIIKSTQGDVSTPIEDRFLMGGALSLRGWGRNQISPVNEAGDNLGGNSMFESSAELRFPLYGILSATAFMDVGNTWQNSWDFDLNALHYDVGLGLRLKTPVGPIRFDIATPVLGEKFSAQFFVTIGHAF